MNRVIRKSLAALTCCLVPWLPVKTVSAEVAQVPLFLGGSLAPNIMFTLDDSSSMQRELTEELTSLFGLFVYPPPDGIPVYGGDNSPAQVPDVTENPYGMQSRSSGINKFYYNPKLTYSPWIKKNESGPMESRALSWSKVGALPENSRRPHRARPHAVPRRPSTIE